MKKIPCNLSADHQIPDNEKHLYHIMLVNKEHDPVKKEYINRSVIQKFAPAEYEMMKTIKFFSSYDEVVILHNPTNVVGKLVDNPEELKALVAEYTELFGKAPANNAKPENIKEKVEFAKLSAEYQILFGTEVPDTFKTSEQLNAAISEKQQQK